MPGSPTAAPLPEIPAAHEAPTRVAGGRSLAARPAGPLHTQRMVKP
jgi:hypothetical protein